MSAAGLACGAKGVLSGHSSRPVAEGHLKANDSKSACIKTDRSDPRSTEFGLVLQQDLFSNEKSARRGSKKQDTILTYIFAT